MAKPDKKKFEEFHDGEREFCPESGPLKSRKIKTPSAVMKALVTSVVTAAAVYVAVFAPLFSFIPTLLSIEANVATFEVKIENAPEDSKIIYTLVRKDQPEIVVTTGEINDELLTLENLDYDEEYLLTFYLEQEDGNELLKKLEFTSGKDKEPVIPIVTPVPTPTPTPEPTVEPTPEPTVEPTPTPTPTPTPEATIEPSPEPTPTPEPEGPVIDLQVEEVSVDSAVIFGENDVVKGFLVEETHVFGNVPGYDYEVQIMQNGEVFDYYDSYDEETQTLIISYLGNLIEFGETSTSEVTLSYDGFSVTSTNEVTVPKLTDVTLDVVYNQDGTFTYEINTQGVEPSDGELKTYVELYTDVNEQSTNPEILTFEKDKAAFSQSYTAALNAPGQTLSAYTYVTVVWSLDSAGFAQDAGVFADYRIDDISAVEFTDIREGGNGYVYTTNAKFANLANVTPQTMTFYRQSYHPVWNEADEEELITTLNADEISFDDNGNVIGSYEVTEDQAVGRESNGHTWRIVLTYLDLSDTVQTIELIENIEPFSPVYNHLNSVMWQSDDGITYADYEMVFSISPTYSHKGADLVSYNTYNWDVLSAEFELTDTHGFIRGQMTTTSRTDMSFNAYMDWYGTEAEEYIYSGCGGASYLVSALTSQKPVLNNDGTGYESVTEEFTLYNGVILLSEYTDAYVLVTLADGSQIKVTETQPDASGTVSVNWNDNDNLVVTVNQTNVAFGQQTVVDFVQESVRDEEMMLGLVNSFVYRCFSNY